jgi:hypothetical protein
MYTKWFCALKDDLMRMLTLLEACECCFAGADSPVIGSELRGFGAKGADQSGTPFVRSALTSDGNGSCGMPWRPSMECNGVMGRFGAEGATRVVALALS